MFATTVVLKLVMWALTALGLYLAARAALDGEIGIALLLVFIIIPIVLWGASIVLGLASMLLIFPLAALVGRVREMREFTNFQLAIADQVGADRLNLRQGWMLLRMFEKLPRRAPGEPVRSGEELVWLYEELHAGDLGDEEEGLRTPEQPSPPGTS